MEKRIGEVLKDIGFGKVEVDTYLDLLRSQKSTAADVAKRTHQHRSNVYDALKRLQQKGFITEIKEQKKTFFESENPEVIFSYLKQKESEVRAILPILERLSRKSSEQDTSSISYGLPRVRAILYELVESEKELLLWGISDNMEFLGDAFAQGFLKNRAKKKAKTRILFDGKFESIDTLSKIKYHEIKYLPKYDSKTMAIVSNDIVFMVVFNQPVMIIEMKGDSLVQWYKSQFEMLWKMAHPHSTVKQDVVKKATTLKKKVTKLVKKLQNSNKKK